MATSDQRVRREPPKFRRVKVARVEPLSARMVRAAVTGPELDGFTIPEPAASVRMLLPSTGTSSLAMPDWNGNEFLLPGGERPVIRTFTPRNFDPQTLELDIDIVLHEGGAASAWVQQARPGDPVAVSGPGRGYRIDPGARSFFLAGDETAIPALCQLLENMDDEVPVEVIIEIAHPDAHLDLPVHRSARVVWVERASGTAPGTALIDAVAKATIEPNARVWVAGEAGSLVPIRKHLLQELGLERSDVTARGYWKHDRRLLRDRPHGPNGHNPDETA